MSLGCYADGCEKPGAVQWSRLHTPEEAAAAVQAVQAGLTQHLEEERRSLRYRIAALQDAADEPPRHLSPADVQAFKERAASQIKELQEQHDAVPTSVDLRHHQEGSSVALAACEDHKHEDAEWYARAHGPSCSNEPGCGCA